MTSERERLLGHKNMATAAAAAADETRVQLMVPGIYSQRPNLFLLGRDVDEDEYFEDKVRTLKSKWDDVI